MPKVKKDLKKVDIENDSVNILKSQEVIKMSKDDIIPEAENTYDQLIKKEEQGENIPSSSVVSVQEPEKFDLKPETEQALKSERQSVKSSQKEQE